MDVVYQQDVALGAVDEVIAALFGDADPWCFIDQADGPVWLSRLGRCEAKARWQPYAQGRIFAPAGELRWSRRDAGLAVRVSSLAAFAGPLADGHRKTFGPPDYTVEPRAYFLDTGAAPVRHALRRGLGDGDLPAKLHTEEVVDHAGWRVVAHRWLDLC